VKFTLENAGGANLIRGWEEGVLVVNAERHQGCVLVAADTISPMPLVALEDVTLDSLAPALTLKPEILLIGSGLRQRFLPPTLVAALGKNGVGVEVMDTIAAARTYNVLVDEGRRVAAVLLPANV